MRFYCNFTNPLRHQKGLVDDAKKYPIKLHFGRGISRLSIFLNTPLPN